jgi:FtsH-binding integral membrane protein
MKEDDNSEIGCFGCFFSIVFIFICMIIITFIFTNKVTVTLSAILLFVFLFSIVMGFDEQRIYRHLYEKISCIESKEDSFDLSLKECSELSRILAGRGLIRQKKN